VSLAPLEMSVPAGDGLVLKGTLSYPPGAAGQGFPLAVLAHQYPATRDSWSPLVADLLALGVATLAFDLRGHGASIISPKGPLVIDTPEGVTPEAFGTAFVASAGKVGFSRIPNDILRAVGWGVFQNYIDGSRLLLLGASVGGSGVLLAAPDIPGIRGVATLGAAGAPAIAPDGPARVRAAVERLQAPFYLGSSRDDPFDGAGNVAAWSQGLAPARTRIVPGAAHAMAIYFDLRDELLEFLRSALLLR
jgi:pimeloyl-ACP methyl ester carboxylesterase